MLKYESILVATDFAEDSDRTIQKAVDLAKQMGSKLSILHVVEPLPGYGYAFVGAADVEVQLLDEAKRQLKILGEKYGISAVDQYVEMGPTKVEITRIAEENNMDLIVVGSHGRHGLADLLGSTANAVIHNAKCDVLTVRIKE